MGDNCAGYLRSALLCPESLSSTSSLQEKAMDIQKIIHNALYEFIQSYIPDADLR